MLWLLVLGFGCNKEGTMSAHQRPATPAAWKTCPIPTDAELRRLLTPEQYAIVREQGTERPFHNAYWNHKAAGLYVDIVTGEPLFASTHKFDSQTGWPSFTEPIDKERLLLVTDDSHGMIRTEVRAKRSSSHLGHVFDDGPPPSGQRYCINSAALRFVPVEQLTAEGYGEYLPLFQ